MGRTAGAGLRGPNRQLGDWGGTWPSFQRPGRSGLALRTDLGSCRGAKEQIIFFPCSSQAAFRGSPVSS